MADIFISYSRKDSEFVLKLRSQLAQQRYEVWLDKDSIPYGIEWRSEIQFAIDAADAVLVVLSPDSVASPECNKEIGHALANRKRIIPLLRRAVTPNQVQREIAALNWLPFDEGCDFGVELERLVETLKTDVDWVRAHSRLLTRAREWDTKGRNSSFVLRGEDLIGAENWLAQAASGKLPAPTQLQTEFIIESRQSQARVQRKILAGVTLGMIVAIALSLLFLFQRNESNRQRKIAVEERNVATSRSLAVEATSQLTTDAELSVLLSMEAMRVQHTAEAENALRASIAASRVRTVLRGHTSGIHDAEFSPDGKLVVTAGWDKSAGLWDAATGKRLRELRGHRGELWTATFSPDGRMVVTASGDRTARVWDVQNGNTIAKLRGHSDQVICASFSPDGRRVVTGSLDRTVRVWDARTGILVATMHGHRDNVSRARFSPDGNLIVSSSMDRTARLWDAATGRSVAILRGHLDKVNEGEIEDAAFSPDGQWVATASRDTTTRLWRIPSGQPGLVLRGHTSNVETVVWDPSGSRLVTSSFDGTARVWDARTGSVLRELRPQGVGLLSGASFSPDGKWIVTFGSYTAQVWSATENEPIAWLRGHTGDVATASFSPDGTEIITSSSDGTARVWEPGLQLPTRTFPGNLTQCGASSYLNPTGTQVIGVSTNVARVWDVTTGAYIAELISPKAAVTAASFSPDGRLAITTGANGTARIWDAETWNIRREIQGPGGPISCAGFDSDGKIAVTVTRQTARVWDTAKGTLLSELRASSVITGISFNNANGTQLTTVGRGTDFAQVWDTRTGKEILRLRQPIFGLTASVSPDGLLAIAGPRSAQIWDAVTGKIVRDLLGHTDQLNSAEFSRDGKRIVTSSFDHTARVWDVATGSALAVLVGQPELVNSASFSLDGRWVVAAGNDGSTRVWDSGSGQTLAIFRGGTRAVTAQFTADSKFIVTESAELGKAENPTINIYQCLECSPANALLSLGATRVTRELTLKERSKYVGQTPVAEEPNPSLTGELHELWTPPQNMGSEKMIAYDQWSRGTVGHSDEQHSYLFDGNKDDHIGIVLLSAEDSELDPALVLVDPQNRILAEDDDGGRRLGPKASSWDAVIETILPGTGRYRVIVRTVNGEPGDYKLIVIRGESMPQSAN
jgi:WD40 repeat protein